MIKKPHLGRNIRRIRAFRSMKQATMGSALRISQQAVSIMEGQEMIGEPRLEQVAEILEVTTDLMKLSDEASMMMIISMLVTKEIYKPTNKQKLIALLLEELNEDRPGGLDE